MFTLFYQLFLTLNSTSLVITIFFIKEQMYIPILKIFPFWISYLVFLSVPVILTGISLLLTKFLSNDSIEGGINDLEYANNTYLPNYLGYFFIALSITNKETLLFVYLIIFLFTFFSQTLYFNPLFLLWGNHFYYLTTQNKVKIFLITKKKIRYTNDIQFNKLKRINNYTYIDRGGKEFESFDCED